MVLVAAVQFARNFVAWATCTCSAGASALNHEIRKNTVKRKSVVKAALSEFDKVGYGAGRICMVELNMHVAFFGMDDCFFHGAKIVSDLAHSATLRLKFYRRGAENAKFNKLGLQLAHCSLELTSSVFVVLEEVERSTSG